ncbi:MAG: three-Cys-motif partner protein TcmP [Acidobacteria bacterium]|nr:three-Cys-motif partner protein TcmP [Acidobacteriota bacterium]
MTDQSFFEESREQSVVKATIVSKYFWAWARVIIPSVKTRARKIAYLDLFAGPGRYRDGTKSTPLLILQQAIHDPNMREMLVTIFNDKDDRHSHELQAAIQALPGVQRLKYKPVVLNEEVGARMVKQFETTKLEPTLFFVDPWGYKGLSLELVNSVLKDWGCDCVFFFNYNRISMGLSNPAVEEHMNALFGPSRADELRPLLDGLSSTDRELLIVEELCKALGAGAGRYVLPFRFLNDHGTRTSHHLIFVSKHFRGYEIMKSIMAKESSKRDQGVPSFEYNPADNRFPTLFELTAPLDELEERLLREYAGERLTMENIYRKHNVGRPYIERNYKDALMSLEAKGTIQCQPPARERRKGTMGPDTIVTFPKVSPHHVA